MDLRPKCTNCDCAMDAHNIRALPSGGFICRTCLDVKEGKSVTITANPIAEHSEELFSKKKYLCQDCSYMFERNATFTVNCCPMCASESIHHVIDEETQEWLLQ